MPTPPQRLLSILILVLWIAPSAGALGVGLHVALDPHHQHGIGHAGDLSELALAAVHGHHHGAEAAPDHEHDAIVDGVSARLRPSPAPVVILPSPSAPGASFADPPSPLPPSTHGPPTLLFTAHCSLLL